MFLFWLGKKGKRRKTITEAVFCGDCGQLPHLEWLICFLASCKIAFPLLKLMVVYILQAFIVMGEELYLLIIKRLHAETGKST